jgi:hypothetical protein
MSLRRQSPRGLQKGTNRARGPSNPRRIRQIGSPVAYEQGVAQPVGNVGDAIALDLVADWEGAVGIVMIVKREADLLEVCFGS